ncbi:MAG: hypothetical protein ABIL37_05070 [candidate division WOR-3 bacterium]
MYAQVRSLDEKSMFLKDIQDNAYKLLKSAGHDYLIQAGPITFILRLRCSMFWNNSWMFSREFRQFYVQENKY